MLFFNTLPRLKKNGSVSGVRLFQIFYSSYEREPMLKMWIKELQSELDRIAHVKAEKQLKVNLAKIEQRSKQPEPVQPVVKVPVIKDLFTNKIVKRSRENCKQTRLLKYLQENSMIRADKAEEMFKIVNVSSVINKLRSEGHNIVVMHRNSEAGITRAIYVLKD
jgi:biopolymer transport protein ExbD